MILTGVYMHKFSNIELIALRPSTMYAKIGVKTILLHLAPVPCTGEPMQRKKIRDPDSGARSCSDAQFLRAIKI